MIKIVKPKIQRIKIHEGNCTYKPKNSYYNWCICKPFFVDSHLKEKTIFQKGGKLTHYALKVDANYYFCPALDELAKLCNDIEFISFEYNKCLKGIVHNEKNKTYFTIGSFEQVEFKK